MCGLGHGMSVCAGLLSLAASRVRAKCFSSSLS